MEKDRSEDVHQGLMNKAYDKWQDQDWDWEEFLDNLDVLERHAVTIGKLNQQVCNGGFAQWFFNGYHEGRKYLRQALKAVGTDTAKKVLDLVNSAPADEEEADNSRRFLDKLDKEFYTLNEQLLDDCETYFKKEGAVCGAPTGERV